MKSVSETSGMLTSGYGPRNIIFGVRRLGGALAWIRQMQSGVKPPLQRAATIHDSADQTAAKMYIDAQYQSCLARKNHSTSFASRPSSRVAISCASAKLKADVSRSSRKRRCSTKTGRVTFWM